MNLRRTARRWKIALIKREVEDDIAWKIGLGIYFLAVFLLIMGYFLGHLTEWYVRWAETTLFSTFLFIVLTNSINTLTGNIKFPADWGRR